MAGDVRIGHPTPVLANFYTRRLDTVLSTSLHVKRKRLVGGTDTDRVIEVFLKRKEGGYCVHISVNSHFSEYKAEVFLL